MIFLIDDTYFLLSLFFVCSKSGTLLRRWPPTVPESAQQTDRSSHSRTVHPKTGEHHREQSRQPTSGCAGPAIAGSRGVQPAHHVKQGRLAAAGGSHNGHKLAVLHREVHAVKGAGDVRLCAVIFFQVDGL